MPTTYAAAVSLADSMFIAPSNPHGWVLGFYENPAKFLQDRAQPFADAGIKLMLHNAFGRGGKTRTFSKRFDGKDASVTAAEWIWNDTDQCFALSGFVKSPGIEDPFFYVGTPDTRMDATLRFAAYRLEDLAHWFPRVSFIYDNTGDIDSSELCAGSALFAAHDAMARYPFNSPVTWGIEPNPATASGVSPLDKFMPDYVYGTPLTWDAPTRDNIEDCRLWYGIKPIVAIRGDDYKTSDERLAVAREWGPRVEPFNGIVVVHGVSVEQMEGLTK